MENILAGMNVRCVLDARDELGESIVWCAEERAL